MKELEGKIRELGEAESAEREALKEEFTERLDQRVGDLASEVGDGDEDNDAYAGDDYDDYEYEWQGCY